MKSDSGNPTFPRNTAPLVARFYARMIFLLRARVPRRSRGSPRIRGLDRYKGDSCTVFMIDLIAKVVKRASREFSTLKIERLGKLSFKLKFY